MEITGDKNKRRKDNVTSLIHIQNLVEVILCVCYNGIISLFFNYFR